jgi:hypothetical protein
MGIHFMKNLAMAGFISMSPNSVRALTLQSVSSTCDIARPSRDGFGGSKQLRWVRQKVRPAALFAERSLHLRLFDACRRISALIEILLFGAITHHAAGWEMSARFLVTLRIRT